MMSTMRLNETVRYDGATPEQVFTLLCDESFRAEVCATLGSRSHDVRVERGAEDVTVTIERVLPADMPDFVKKLTGETVTVVQTEVWGAAGPDGARTADVEVQIKSQPASMSGTSSLRAGAGGTELALDGEVEVAVPFIGRRVEPEVAKAIASALRTEAEEGSARLRG